MKLKRIAGSVLATVLTLGTGAAMAQYPAQAPQGYNNQPAYGYAQDRGGWDVAPRGYNQIQQRGFRDGIEGARKDFGNKRRFNVNNRDEYKRPDGVPRGLLRDYRRGFRQGYHQAASNLVRRVDRR